MKHAPLFLAMAALSLSGCGGGGGGSGGAASGLEMPQNMSVVSAQDSSPAAALKAANIKALNLDYKAISKALYDQAGTNYSTDPTHTWVWDDSLEPLQMVNEILCYVGQSAADEMVNQGAYTALIDEEKCQQGQNTSSDTGQSSGQSTELNLWTIQSTRANNAAPQLVKIWVPPSNEAGDTESILVEVTTYAGVSATMPFGSFKMNFKGVDEGTGATGMTGSLFTVDANTDPANANAGGNPHFKLIINGEEQGFNAGTFAMMSNVLFDDANGDSGKAHISSAFTPTAGPSTFSDTFKVAFNATHFLREGELTDPDTGLPVTANACTDRNDFNTHVWRYNMYYSDNAPVGKVAGARVQVNSGFPIKVSGDFDSDGSSETEYGWMGYWGLWLPEYIDTTTLSSVTKDSFGSDVSTVYDLVQAPGKLIKSTKTQLLLTEMDGVTFNYFDDVAMSEFLVEYTTDTTLSDSTVVAGAGFYKTASISFTPSGQTLTPVSPPVDITPATGVWLGMWSQSLGGSVNYIGDDLSITFFQESFVNTGTAIAEMFNTTNDPNQDGVVEIDCYVGCLNSNISQADADNPDPNTVFRADAADVPSPTPAVTYQFKKADLTLYEADGVTPITLASGVTPGSTSPHQWGMQTHAMVLGGTAMAGIWDGWNEPVSYRWETGHNQWNRTFAVKVQGGSSFEEFDAPLQMTYKFVVGDDANAATAAAGTAHYNKTFLLEYGGEGDLWGIPWEQAQGGDRWYTAFTLADGTLLGGSNEYVIKAMEKEQTMKDVAMGNCSTLNVATIGTDLPLPTAAEIGSVSITLADKPVVTDAPAVIEGEVQG